MIKLLAPTTVASADDPDNTAIVECDRHLLRALGVAVEIAFEDPTAVPDEYREAANELWAFFHPSVDPVTLAEGMLTWGRYERVGDRYGLIVIQTEGVAEFVDVDPDQRYLDRPKTTEAYADFADAPIGTDGTLVAEVLATRESGHIGDMFHGLSPVKPEVGERIVLGHGTLFTDEAWEGATGIGLKPLTDERQWGDYTGGPDTFWLDPRALYRTHEQTVRLVFEPGDAA